MKVHDDVFWSKTVKNGDCIEYRLSPDRAGYGRVNRRKISNSNIRAHRYAMFLLNGEMPIGFVCHKCDNPKCVNTEHLFIGTHQENMDDMVRKGRSSNIGRTQVGELNSNAKLSYENVLRIRELISIGEKNTNIAVIFGVTHQMISRIRNNKSWH